MAYSYVNSAQFSSNNSPVATSGVMTLAVTAGNTLIVTVACDVGAGVPLSGITDQSGGALSFVQAGTTVTGTVFSMAVYYLVNVPTSPTGIIVNLSVSTQRLAVQITQYSGIAGTIDGVAIGTATATLAANNVVFPSITNANQPALFYAVGFDDTTYTAGPTAGTGFTFHGNLSDRVPQPTNLGNNPGIAEDKRLTATGSQTATMNNNAVSGDLYLMISLALDEIGISPNTASIAWVT
jgi:hypothetical protein